MVDFNALIAWKKLIDICFSIKSSLWAFTAAYTKFRRMIWSMIWAVACGHRSRSPNLDVYCYLIETPGDFTGEKLKAYNFVISGWVKPLHINAEAQFWLRQPWRNLPFLSPSSLRLLPFPLFNEGLRISPWQNCWIKDVCRLVLQHFDSLMRLIIFPWNKKVNSPTNFLICFVARYFRDAFCVAGIALVRPWFRCIRRLTRHAQDFTMEGFTSRGHGQGV